MWPVYEIPTSVEEALRILGQHDGQAQIVAGGTDLIIELQEGRHSVECLVDMTRIPGLDRSVREGGQIIESHPRTSPLRASKEYRTELVKVLVRRGLERAVAQARERAV